MRLVILAFVLCSFAAPFPCAAQIGAKKQGDPRVKELLDRSEMKYEVDSDGDFKLINVFDNGRSHVVYIVSETSRLGDLEIREIFSIGYLAADGMPEEVARNLLMENRRIKLGAWALAQAGEREAGVFRAQIAADTDAKTLLLTLRVVSKTADDKENELLESDDL